MSITTTSPKARATRKSATPATTAVHLPTNLALALKESAELVGYESAADFLVNLTADMFTPSSGFLESLIDGGDYRRIASQLARIRKKYGFSEVENVISDEPELRSIMFPAENVRLLEELLEASGTALSLSDYAREFLSSEITDTLEGIRNGVISTLSGSYQLEPEDFTAMQAVVDRWNARKAATA